jgi:hypothetical protein
MYFLFAGDDRYSSTRSMDNCMGSYDSMGQILRVLMRLEREGCGIEWYQVAQVQDGKLVLVEEGVL